MNQKTKQLTSICSRIAEGVPSSIVRSSPPTKDQLINSLMTGVPSGWWGAWACLRGWGDCLAWLLTLGLDPNWRTPAGDSLLHVAVASKHRKCAGMLLAFKADPLYQNSDGFTPLQLMGLESILEFKFKETYAQEKKSDR